MRNLTNGYSAEVDSIDKDELYQILSGFSDANIYQTWEYGIIRSSEKRLSHFLLKKEGKVVANALVRIMKIPYINIGIAYIYWGPMWKSSGSEINVEHFRQAIRALRNEYVHKRKLILRIFPVLFDDESDLFSSLLEEEGFKPIRDFSDRTLIMDLNPSLEDLRAGLKKNWRRHLNRAEKNEIEVFEGDELFPVFIEIYREMLLRKRFATTNDINEFRSIQQNLPRQYKMKIMLCKFENEFCAGAIFSAMGNKGICPFSATNDKGMKSNGSYLLQWKFIEWLKENNFRYYDLSGINPKRNPGTYEFKKGLCGNNGKDVNFLGKFDAYKNHISYMAVRFGEVLVSYYKRARRISAN